MIAKLYSGSKSASRSLSKIEKDREQELGWVNGTHAYIFILMLISASLNITYALVPQICPVENMAAKLHSRTWFLLEWYIAHIFCNATLPA